MLTVSGGHRSQTQGLVPFNLLLSFGAFCLDVRTSTLCQPTGFPVKALKVSLKATEP